MSELAIDRAFETRAGGSGPLFAMNGQRACCDAESSSGLAGREKDDLDVAIQELDCWAGT